MALFNFNIHYSQVFQPVVLQSLIIFFVNINHEQKYKRKPSLPDMQTYESKKFHVIF